MYYCLLYVSMNHHNYGFIRIRPNMQLTTWSVYTSVDYANFVLGIFARWQHPHYIAAGVLKRVVDSIFRVYVLRTKALTLNLQS